jgi:hypothetical protein
MDEMVLMTMPSVKLAKTKRAGWWDILAVSGDDESGVELGMLRRSLIGILWYCCSHIYK